MEEVTKEEFDEFLKNKQYTKDQGMYFHSENYIDYNTKEIIAYFEASSYGAPDIFKIKK